MADHELWSFFSDCYKSANGFRPTGQYWTVAEVNRWFDDERATQKAEAQNQANLMREYDLLPEWVTEADYCDAAYGAVGYDVSGHTKYGYGYYNLADMDRVPVGYRGEKYEAFAQM